MNLMTFPYLTGLNSFPYPLLAYASEHFPVFPHTDLMLINVEAHLDETLRDCFVCGLKNEIIQKLLLTERDICCWSYKHCS